MKIEELKCIVAEAQRRYAIIRSRHSSFSGYLVFSSPYGQCNLTDNPVKVLEEFPDMFEDSRSKKRAVALIDQVAQQERIKKDSYSADVKKSAERHIKKALAEVISLLPSLEMKADISVEIRFIRAELSVIFDLQKDPLVVDHTPQGKASILIAIGTLEELSRAQSCA